MLARLGGQQHAHAVGIGPVCGVGSWLEGVIGRHNELTISVLHLSGRDFVTLSVSIFNVAEGTLDALYVRSYAFIALATHTGWPPDGVAGTDFILELGVSLRQVIGPEEGRARTVSAVDHGNRKIRQFHIRVDGSDCLVVPFADLTEVDCGDEFRRKLQLARLDAI